MIFKNHLYVVNDLDNVNIKYLFFELIAIVMSKHRKFNKKIELKFSDNSNIKNKLL
jgi:hypothetical protein